MGILDGFYQRIIDGIVNRLVGDASQNQGASAMRYYSGAQPKQLRVAPQQFDDNLTANLCGVITDRAVSQLVGHGLEFDFEGDAETAAEQWLKAALDANHFEILSQRAALSAALAGTGYITLMPDAMIGEDGQSYPRIVLLSPQFMTIDTLPDDWEIVTRYTMQYKSKDLGGKDIAKRRVWENDPETGRWAIVDYESRGQYLPRWEEVARMDWQYDFPPVLHWQNIPALDSQYGKPEIDVDGYELQDRLNFTQSNISKIIRLYAHPQRYMVNASAGARVDVGPDQIPNITADATAGGGLFQLPVVGDLASSMEFAANVRHTLFDITRTVDLDSLEDKLGQVTNFGLRVLYQDNMSKVQTKRRLFEDMLEELGRRMCMMAGVPFVPFEVVWPEIIPVNLAEQAQLDQAQLTMGIVSKQTLSDRYGLDYETEQERITQEEQTGYERLPAQ